ncbi:MAG: 2-oxoacid:acceptor oxidoreductase subunit alpha [Chloroflexi bacterium]|nr:2-oxoacid:acceptor oxidoreductase subunit alpha [Chloroflexota bacterium]
MTENSLSWMIGGPALTGGVNRSAELFAKACTRAGLYVFSNVEYHSNIMGRHISYRVRTSDKPVHSHVEHVDLLLALDAETLFGTPAYQDYQRHGGHLHRLAPDGVVILDSKAKVDHSAIERDDIHVVALAYDDVVRESVEELGMTYNARRHSVMRNMVPIGASCALLDFDISHVVSLVAEVLPAHRQDMVEMNRHVLQHAAEQARRAYAKEEFHVTLRPRPERNGHMLIKGVDAVGIAKIHAGCAFQTYYPIAPASDESVMLERHQTSYPIVVLQAEDEIASMNMAVGAAHAGVRAATSTAGPGFSLMAEGLGFASITESAGPIVVLWQRGGPSTGLPTRQSQQDLRFALQPAHGEFPHIVVAPGDAREAARITHMAFNWGDRYQMPVVVLADKFIANSLVTLEDLGLDGLPVDRGEYWTLEMNGSGPYRRHRLTESGISPRAVFGTPGGQYVTTSDEHTERGRIDEQIENRMAQMDKRMQKLDLAAEEISDEWQYELVGPEEAAVTIVGWGSTRGPIMDALPVLESEHGISANFLQIRLLRPFPAAVVHNALSRARRVVLVEDNYMGQLGMLIAEQTGIKLERLALKYDGRPFSQDEVVEAVCEHNEADIGRLVLSHP